MLSGGRETDVRGDALRGTAAEHAGTAPMLKAA
jgi:hypothetical protein